MKTADLVVGEKYWVIHPHPQHKGSKKEQLTYLGTNGKDTRTGHTNGMTMHKFGNCNFPECQVGIFVYATENEATVALTTAQAFLDSHSICGERICPYGLTESCARFS